MLQQLKKHETPDSFRGKVLQKVQRASYPFRSETLSKLRQNVDSIQGRLSLALQALQLDTSCSIANSLARMSLQQENELLVKIQA